MNIPGLTDENVEIYAMEHPKCEAAYGGKRIGLWDLPEFIIDMIRREAFSDKVAMKTFREEGITDKNVILEMWAWCNLGRYDLVPDVVVKTGKINKEYHDCGKRDKCPLEFRRCSRISVDGERITPRETKYIRYVANGYSNKEIASKMHQQASSMISLGQNVKSKLKVPNNAAVAAFVMKSML